MGAVKSIFHDETGALDVPRDSKGRFAQLVCVNAHDRCYGGAGGPCLYCEVRERR